MTSSSATTRQIHVWDFPLRLFHWTFALSIAGAILSAELADEFGDAMDWHKRFGFAVLALLIFRVTWGFVGGTHARFANFVRGPASIMHYLKNAPRQVALSAGHNPLGALSVLALLATTIFQAISGLFISDEIMTEGPLYKYISNSVAHGLAEVHEGNGIIIITLILLHLAAILFYRVIKRENLITPMITGRKTVEEHHPAQDAQGGSILLALIVIAGSAGLVWYIATKL